MSTVKWQRGDSLNVHYNSFTFMKYFTSLSAINLNIPQKMIWTQTAPQKAQGKTSSVFELLYLFSSRRSSNVNIILAHAFILFDTGIGLKINNFLGGFSPIFLRASTTS